MKCHCVLPIWIGIILMVLVGYSAQDDFPVLKGPYLGQKRPGDTPVLFAKETLAKHGQLHGCPVFSPDGNEVYWSQMGKGYEGIFFMKRVNNKWTNPKKPSFLSAFRFTDVPCFSPDGQRLYFIVQSPSDYDENIMYVERKDNGWSSARSVGRGINDLDLHWQLSVTHNLDIYFHVRNEGRTDGIIYYAKFENESYRKPGKLDKTINTEAWELAPYVSPDGSYIIFARMTRTKDTDLFISFKDSTGNWKEAINMGESINSPATELCPNVTPDDKYLFFLSTRDGESLAYWVDAKIIGRLKPEGLK